MKASQRLLVADSCSLTNWTSNWSNSSVNTAGSKTSALLLVESTSLHIHVMMNRVPFFCSPPLSPNSLSPPPPFFLLHLSASWTHDCTYSWGYTSAIKDNCSAWPMCELTLACWGAFTSMRAWSLNQRRTSFSVSSWEWYVTILTSSPSMNHWLELLVDLSWQTDSLLLWVRKRLMTQDRNIEMIRSKMMPVSSKDSSSQPHSFS